MDKMETQDAKDETTEDSDANSEEEILFDAEAENLTSSAWFNPDPGSHKITFLDNGHKETREYEGEEREVAVFKVEVEGEELNWSVTVGKSEVSLWGQLVKVGQAKGGLEGETITLIRQGKKQDTNYTVQEAADL